MRASSPARLERGRDDVAPPPVWRRTACTEGPRAHGASPRSARAKATLGFARVRACAAAAVGRLAGRPFDGKGLTRWLRCGGVRARAPALRARVRQRGKARLGTLCPVRHESMMAARRVTTASTTGRQPYTVRGSFEPKRERDSAVLPFSKNARMGWTIENGTSLNSRARKRSRPSSTRRAAIWCPHAGERGPHRRRRTRTETKQTWGSSAGSRALEIELVEELDRPPRPAPPRSNAPPDKRGRRGHRSRGARPAGRI